MHILNRMLVVTLMMLVVLPLCTSALVFPEERAALKEQLEETLEKARSTYSTRSGLGTRATVSKKTLTSAQKKLLELGKKKRAVRLKLAAVIKAMKSGDAQAAVFINNQMQAASMKTDAQADMEVFLHMVGDRRVSMETGPVKGRTVFQRLFGLSLGQSVHEGIREEAIATVREDLVLRLAQAEELEKLTLLRLHSAAGDTGNTVATLQKELEELQTEYMKTLKQAEKAEDTIILSEIQLQQVKRITSDVHKEVLRMQADLARIDERVRRRVERSLIEKGLRSARPGEYSDGSVVGTDQFAWPVIGKVSAGFHDEKYKKFFSVPHLGMDIVVPQNTAVRSSADGVVFLVREGGATGYTYVLIGHRDGYATLYGHLSSVSVSAGDDVEQGQVIGQSGGAPGTVGAGPMTTGAHLHFEVIKGGANVNPRNVLP